jgi:predicted metal-dependent phosphoesterase TrpH
VESTLQESIMPYLHLPSFHRAFGRATLAAWFACTACSNAAPSQQALFAIAADDIEEVDASEPDSAVDEEPELARDVGPTQAGPRLWLKGDLHVHSDHSTDAKDDPMSAVIPKAEALGFDYLAFTDHDNHVQGMLTTWDDPAFHSDKVTLLYGVEWTTAKGHANIFGSERFDHAPMWAARDQDGSAAVAAAHAQGLHFSPNHIMAKDLWEYSFDLPYDSIEVWCAPFQVPNDNVAAIAKWDDLLRAGKRIPARGGSDTHHQQSIESTLYNLGNPTTWIHARDRTASAILAGLSEGRTSISYASNAERLDFTADLDGDGTYETTVGDNVEPDGKPIAFKVEIVGHRPFAPYRLTVFKNGTKLKTRLWAGRTFRFQDTPARGAETYYRVELRGDVPEAPLLSAAIGFGDFIAMTSPIYMGFDE